VDEMDVRESVGEGNHRNIAEQMEINRTNIYLASQSRVEV